MSEILKLYLVLCLEQILSKKVSCTVYYYMNKLSRFPH